jgi:hypothetical protein
MGNSASNLFQQDLGAPVSMPYVKLRKYMSYSSPIAVEQFHSWKREI